MADSLLHELPITRHAPPGPGADRAHLARRARRLSWLSLAWVTAEGVVGVAAGLSAASIALVGWGLGSAIEGLASVVVIWRLRPGRPAAGDAAAERRAQQLVAVSFFLLAPYVAVESVVRLAGGERPSTSVAGIAVTATAVVLMPALGRAKQRLGAALGSSATAGEGRQNLLCALQAAAVLAGLAANAAFGAWWLDGVAGIAVAGIALREGRDAWRGDSCACC